MADSSCDLSPELKKKLNIELVPLKLRLGEKEYTDDESLDIHQYIKDMREAPMSPKTSCPTPFDFLKAIEGDAENIFVVTISSKLSGTYNSAVLAKNMFMEEVGKKFIHVFDTLSATIGETMVSLHIQDLVEKNFDHNEIAEKVSDYIQEMKTIFLLASTEHLAKAGRLNPLLAKLASVLSIKPIMCADNGTIKLLDKARGYEKAFKRFIDIIGEEGTKLEDKVLGIAHCNCLDRALQLKEELMKRYRFKDIVIVETKGLSSTYAQEGGLIVSF